MCYAGSRKWKHDHEEEVQGKDIQIYTGDSIEKTRIVEGPPPQKKYKCGKIIITQIKRDFKNLTSRTSPAALVNAIPKLNQRQRRVVIDMGFGSLLELEIIEFPFYLAH